MCLDTTLRRWRSRGKGFFREIIYRQGGGPGSGRAQQKNPRKTAPGDRPPGLFLVLPSGRLGRRDTAYIPTFSLYHGVVWDFGRVMGSHQARLMMSWERRPMARETLKKTV